MLIQFILLPMFLAMGMGILHPPRMYQANYSVQYAENINRTQEIIYEFIKNNDTHEGVLGPPRISVTSNASISTPLMITTRQPKELLSWRLPLSVETDNGLEYYWLTSKTLCYDILKANRLAYILEHDSPIVTLATSSDNNINFTLEVDYQEYFYLDHSVTYEVKVSPSQPQYFFYNFSTPRNTSDKNKADSNYDTVILEVGSNDNICTTVSIQNVSCPVFDTNEDISYRGFYETFTTKGGITIPKFKFPYGFYIVFVAKGDDFDCTGSLTSSIDGDREKTLFITIKPSITYQDYVLAIILTFTAIGFFYFIFLLSFCFCAWKCYSRPELISDNVLPTPGVSVQTAPLHNDNSDAQSLDEIDYDYIEEYQTDRELRLCRSQIFLSDLARKNPQVLVKKSYLYLYNVLTVAIFYGLPVVQLVIIYQTVLNQTGEQDLCYYNFLCAHPLGFLSDFNHVFSNLGYVTLGVLFLFITYYRETTFHRDADFDRDHGIPQHYGHFYAMGVALITEGILSGCYHVCPNQTNFQFDTSFMYVMAVLCMIKLYQNRHPDINANAYTTFGVLAIAIVLGLIGIFENSEGFWIFFVIIHLISCFYLSIKMYYMGCWKLNMQSIWNVGHTIRNDLRSGPLNVLRIRHKARFVMLLLGNGCNWALAMYAIVNHPKNFAVFLLLVFMSNTVLYFLFYVIMKYLHKERVRIVTWIFLIISTICAVSAMYFFLSKSTSWSKTPAQSRTYNMECKVLRFYDFHDIWHFLSAIGMFFTFMCLLTLDDDLAHTHRSTIAVF